MAHDAQDNVKSGQQVAVAQNLTPAQKQKQKLERVQNEIVARPEEYATLLEPYGIKVEFFSAIVRQSLIRNPDLLDCTTASLLQACAHAAQAGLPPDGKRAAIAKFGNQATFMAMTRGLLDILHDAKDGAGNPLCKDITVEVIYEGEEDRLEMQLGDDGFIKFSPPLDREIEKPLAGAFAIIRMTNGGVYREVISGRELRKIAAVSRAKSGPNKEWKNEMARKGVLRRLLKRLPTGDRMHHVLLHDENNYSQVGARDVTPTGPQISHDQLFEDKAAHTAIEGQVIEPEVDEEDTPLMQARRLLIECENTDDLDATLAYIGKAPEFGGLTEAERAGLAENAAVLRDRFGGGPADNPEFKAYQAAVPELEPTFAAEMEGEDEPADATFQTEEEVIAAERKAGLPPLPGDPDYTEEAQAERKARALAALQAIQSGGAAVQNSGGEIPDDAKPDSACVSEAGDPTDLPCDECGAEAGEACKPDCSAEEGLSDLSDAQARLDEAHDADGVVIEGEVLEGADAPPAADAAPVVEETVSQDADEVARALAKPEDQRLYTLASDPLGDFNSKPAYLQGERRGSAGKSSGLPEFDSHDAAGDALGFSLKAPAKAEDAPQIRANPEDRRDPAQDVPVDTKAVEKAAEPPKKPAQPKASTPEKTDTPEAVLQLRVSPKPEGLRTYTDAGLWMADALAKLDALRPEHKPLFWRDNLANVVAAVPIARRQAGRILGVAAKLKLEGAEAAIQDHGPF